MASSREIPTGAVTSGMRVMTSRPGRWASVSNRMSRLVTMPSSTPRGVDHRHPGDPVVRAQPLDVGERRVRAKVTGLVIMPGLGPLDQVDLLRLLLDRQVAVQHAEPPWRAIAIAIRASVTVSIAADTSGIRNVTDRESRVVVSASPGPRSEYAGTSNTSSYVKPCGANLAGSGAKVMGIIRWVAMSGQVSDYGLS